MLRHVLAKYVYLFAAVLAACALTHFVPSLQPFHKFFNWHEGVTIWALVLTLFAIAEQTQQTSRATAAAEAAVATANKALTSQEALSRAELRAYVVVMKVELHSFIGSAYIGEIVLKNCGQTPAYRVRGCVSAGTSDYPIPLASEPTDSLYADANATILGSQATLTVNTDRFESYSETATDISVTGLAKRVFFVRGFYKYMDIFQEEHTIELRFVVGGPVKKLQWTPLKEGGGSLTTMVADRDGNHAD